MSPQKTYVAPNGAAVLKIALTSTAFHILGMAGSQLDVPTIIQTSVAANQADWDAAPGYSFQEKDRDTDGSKTYQVRMIDGSPYQTFTA